MLISNPHNTRIIVGLSGGVDSSVSALLLKQQGYQVEGLFMKNWDEHDSTGFCPYAQDLQDIQSVCQTLDIPLHTVNFAQEYWQYVFSLFLDEYRAGRTPNPDILCNQEIKFKAFLNHALKMGADGIATGHYAQIHRNTPTLLKGVDNNHSFALLKGADNNKDQTYFLYTITQRALAHTLFPIGHLTKPEVRAIAKKAGQVNCAKKDSTGICFIGERPFKTFLSDYLPAQPGEIHTPEGKKVGEHTGLIFYTLGQRQGIGIGGQKDAAPAPWYVVAKDIERNILYVTQNENHPWHFTRELSATDFHWISGNAPSELIECTAKVRYRQQDVPCIVKSNGPLSTIRFMEPQKSVTPGQSIVLYQNTVCLGGGIISSTDAPSTHLILSNKEIQRC